LLSRVGVISGCYFPPTSPFSFGLDDKIRGECSTTAALGKIVEKPKGEKRVELLPSKLFDRFMIFFFGKYTGFSG
jgi:hypothetical protein